jgi:hypothetical protein
VGKNGIDRQAHLYGLGDLVSPELDEEVQPGIEVTNRRVTHLHHEVERRPKERRPSALPDKSLR